MIKQTPIQEITNWLKARMGIFPDEDLSLSQRGAYDAYLNILLQCESKLKYEKTCLIQAYDFGNDETTNKFVEDGEDFYNKTYKNEKIN